MTHLIRSALSTLALLVIVQASGAADISGAWALTLDTPGGLRESTMELTVNGKDVTAKMGETTLKGTFVDGKLELAGKMYAAEVGYEADFTLKGTLEGEELKGDATFDIYEMTFTGKKAE